MNKLLLLGLIMAMTLISVASVHADDRVGDYPTHLQICTYDDGNLNLDTASDDNTTNEDTIVRSSSRGWCEPDWQCTDWGECQPNGKQYRVCTDAWECGTNLRLPDERQKCNYVEPTQEDFGTPNVFQGEGDIVVPFEANLGEQKPVDSSNALTGSVIGSFSGDWRLTLGAGLLIAGLFLILLVGLKRK